MKKSYFPFLFLYTFIISGFSFANTKPLNTAYNAGIRIITTYAVIDGFDGV